MIFWNTQEVKSWSSTWLDTYQLHSPLGHSHRPWIRMFFSVFSAFVLILFYFLNFIFINTFRKHKEKKIKLNSKHTLSSQIGHRSNSVYWACSHAKHCCIQSARSTARIILLEPVLSFWCFLYTEERKKDMGPFQLNKWIQNFQLLLVKKVENLLLRLLEFASCQPLHHDSFFLSFQMHQNNSAHESAL